MESSSKQERFANFSLINRRMHFIPLPPSHSLSFPSRLDKLLKCHVSLSNFYNLIVKNSLYLVACFVAESTTGLNQGRGNKEVVQRQPTCLIFNQFLSSRLIKLLTLHLPSSGLSFPLLILYSFYISFRSDKLVHYILSPSIYNTLSLSLSSTSNKLLFVRPSLSSYNSHFLIIVVCQFLPSTHRNSIVFPKT